MASTYAREAGRAYRECGLGVDTEQLSVLCPCRTEQQADSHSQDQTERHRKSESESA